jgi:spore coat protein CotH
MVSGVSLLALVFAAWLALAGPSSDPPPDAETAPAAAAVEAAPAETAPAAASAAAKASKPKRDPSAAFFATLPVVRLEIQVDEPHLSDLLFDERSYVRSSVREIDPKGGEPKVYRDVGIHLKGARGSYRPFHSNPALTLNFDKFQKGQKFHGIDKLHLNNSVQDRSYLSELLSGELFQAAGVPAARVAFAIVTLNGRPRGLYVLKEGFDRTFLARHFADKDGNLYDGGFINDVDEPLEKTSGSGPDDHSDLARLAAAAWEADPARRLALLEEVLDLERFLSFVAVEMLAWHWDGYAMKRNNYRVYHDPASGRFVFLPHGMDQMFDHARGPIVPDADGLVARAVLSTDAGRERYQRRLEALIGRIFSPDALVARIDEVAPTIREALAELDPELAERHDGAVADLRARVVERVRGVREILAGADPEPAYRGRRRRWRDRGWERTERFGGFENSQGFERTGTR